MTQRPDIIEEYWYSIDWDVEAIWALDLPAAPMAMAELLWHLDVPVWPLGGIFYRVCPREVIARPERHRVEFERIQRADLAFPIDVIRHKQRWMILDGIHRLAKAFLRRQTTIMVRQVPPDAVIGC